MATVTGIEPPTFLREELLVSQNPETAINDWGWQWRTVRAQNLTDDTASAVVSLIY